MYFVFLPFSINNFLCCWIFIIKNTCIKKKEGLKPSLSSEQKTQAEKLEMVKGSSQLQKDAQEATLRAKNFRFLGTSQKNWRCRVVVWHRQIRHNCTVCFAVVSTNVFCQSAKIGDYLEVKKFQILYKCNRFHPLLHVCSLIGTWLMTYLKRLECHTTGVQQLI